jgi:hypothetical protein
MNDPGLAAEVQSLWVQHNRKNRGDVEIRKLHTDYSSVFAPEVREYRLKEKLNVVPIVDRNFGNVITRPRESVLYILAHRDANVAEIGGQDGAGAGAPVIWWTPQQLVDWLTGGPSPLPTDMLCVKVWSCYSGTNGFLPKFQRRLIGAGYRQTVVVGYTRITGAMFAPAHKRVEGEFPHTKAVLREDGTVIGRAKDHRVVLGGPPQVPNWQTGTWTTKPLPEPPPRLPAPVAAAAAPPDDYDDVDVGALIRDLDDADRLQDFMPVRPGPLRRNP